MIISSGELYFKSTLGRIGEQLLCFIKIVHIMYCYHIRIVTSRIKIELVNCIKLNSSPNILYNTFY